MNTKIVQALAIAADVTGTEFSEATARFILRELEAYPEQAALEALRRCCREVKGRLTLSDILSRLDDGRPGVEEAWAAIPRDEYQSVVWTEEMRQAWGVALPLLEEDPVAARMAFKDAYCKLVDKARTNREPVRWSVSLGRDPAGRETVVAEAVRAGKITQAHAKALIPSVNLLECNHVQVDSLPDTGRLPETADQSGSAGV